MGNEILLSIVVPTKNRHTYLKSFIDLFASFGALNCELVIQDNSDCEDNISSYISSYPNQNIVYNYCPQHMPVIENSELAILHSHGEYVCFMGDDDLLSKYIVEVVKEMDRLQIDSAIFNRALYNWPRMKYRSHKFPNLVIPSFTCKYVYCSAKSEFDNLLGCGASVLGRMPQLYHGVVKRKVLDEIRSCTGTFFPGPSPDMAVAVCLSKYVKKYVYVDAPLISSGKSPKSAAGLGAKHQHKGNLNSISFLPSDIESRWDCRLPFVWTGPTIYAQSTIEALEALNCSSDIDAFDFSYFYAYFDTFFKEYSEQSSLAKQSIQLDSLRYWSSRCKIFLNRMIIYVKNVLLTRFKIGGYQYDDIPNTLIAQQIIDEYLERSGIESLKLS